MRLFRLIAAIAVFAATLGVPLHAQECVIADPTDTSVNVRVTPNGKLFNSLRNGREVTITEIRNDAKGRPWGYAVGQYKGQFRKWGWVFMALVKCDSVDSTEKFWLQVASRERKAEAIVLARTYAQRFKGTAIYQSENQWYSVVIGWVADGRLQDTLRSLKASGAIPQDSYGTAGKSFGKKVWSAKAEMAEKPSDAAQQKPSDATAAANKPPEQAAKKVETGEQRPSSSALGSPAVSCFYRTGSTIAPGNVQQNMKRMEDHHKHLRGLIEADPRGPDVVLQYIWGTIPTLINISGGWKEHWLIIEQRDWYKGATICDPASFEYDTIEELRRDTLKRDNSRSGADPNHREAKDWRERIIRYVD